MRQDGLKIQRPTHAVLQVIKVIIFMASAPGAGTALFTSEKSFDLASNNRMAASSDDESRPTSSKPLRLNRKAFTGSVSLFFFNLAINNEKTRNEHNFEKEYSKRQFSANAQEMRHPVIALV